MPPGQEDEARNSLAAKLEENLGTLALIHAAGIAHLDVKLDNILVAVAGPVQWQHRIQ